MSDWNLLQKYNKGRLSIQQLAELWRNNKHLGVKHVMTLIDAATEPAATSGRRKVVISPKLKKEPDGRLSLQKITITQNSSIPKILEQIVNSERGDGAERRILRIRTLSGGTYYYTLSESFTILLETIMEQFGEFTGEEYEDEVANILDQAISMEILDYSAVFPSQGKKEQNHTGKSFFPYWNTSDEIQEKNKLIRYQIIQKKQLSQHLEIFNDNCMVYACKQSGIFTDDEISHMTTSFNIRKDIKTKAASAICKDLGVKLVVRSINKDGKIRSNSVGDSASKRVLELSHHHGHWFVHEIVPHPELVGKPDCKQMSSLRLIQLMDEQGLFEPIKRDDAINITNQFNNKKLEIGDLSKSYRNFRYFRPFKAVCCEQQVKGRYCSKCGEEPSPPASKKWDAIWFADFETINVKTKDAGGNDIIKLEPYLFCADEMEMQHHPISRLVYGEKDPLGRIFTDLRRHSLDSNGEKHTNESKNILVYFHNLKFDFCQIVDLLDESFQVRKIINKAGTVYSVTMYKNCSGYKKVDGGTTKSAPLTVTFRCSYKMMNQSLNKASEIYLGQKYKSPCMYKWYTPENRKHQWASKDEIKQFLEQEDKYFKQSELDSFWDFAVTTRFSEQQDGITRIKMWRYYLYYCQQDCRILRESFKAFRSSMMNIFDLDPLDFLTISSFADRYLWNQGCYDGVYEMTGVAQMFCQQAVVGGRCMTAWGKSWHVKDKVDDFDACSLYASAMARLPVPVGIPEVLNSKSKLGNYKYYIIEVEITDIVKERPFPVLSCINGGRQFINDVKGKIIITDSITLEDFEEYQGGKWKLIRGYGWKQTNTRIQSVIRPIYAERLKIKSLGKSDPKYPVQELLKLVLTSSYGKNIMKMTDTNTVFKPLKDMNSYIKNNYCNIKRITEIGKFFVVESYLEKNEHWNRPHIGCAILSLSKRIMNEVMQLADDIGVQIYYTDTDSMQIRSDGLDRLRAEYQRKYGRALDGDQMGQFHCDFGLNGAANPYSVEGYYLGKKMYGCRLNSAEGVTGYHLVMKGIPKSCVKWDDYVKLAAGETIKYDLLEGVVGIRTTNYISMIKGSFEREIKPNFGEIALVDNNTI